MIRGVRQNGKSLNVKRRGPRRPRLSYTYQQALSDVMRVLEYDIESVWCVMTVSNRRHPVCRTGALPTELITHKPILASIGNWDVATYILQPVDWLARSASIRYQLYPCFSRDPVLPLLTDNFLPSQACTTERPGSVGHQPTGHLVRIAKRPDLRLY